MWPSVQPVAWGCMVGPSPICDVICADGGRVQDFCCRQEIPQVSLAHPHQQRAFGIEAVCPLLPGFVMLYLWQLRIAVFLPKKHLRSGVWRKVTLNWCRQRKVVFLSDVSLEEKKKSWTETRSGFSLNLKSLARECLKDKWELSKEGWRSSRGLAWERTAETEKRSLQWDFLRHPLCRFYG